MATGRRLAAFDVATRAGRLIRRAWAPVHAAVTALAAPALGDLALIDERAETAAAEGACMFVAGCGEDSAVVYGYSPNAKPPSLQARALLVTAGASSAQSCIGGLVPARPKPCIIVWGSGPRVQWSCMFLIACLVALKRIFIDR